MRLKAAGPLFPVLVALAICLAVVVHRYDPTPYENYASMALRSPLLHSLPREYPALSIVLFLLPKALLLPYAVGFALLAAIACAALVVSSDGLAEAPGWSYRTTAYFGAGVLVVIFGRYDIFPALAAFLAVESARRGRWGGAWAWAVLGGLLKLFPFLLLPGFLIAERAQTGRWAVRRAALACVPVAIVGAAQSVVAPGSLLSPLRFELERGFELSSIPGTLTLLASPLHLHWVNGFGTIEIVGPLHAAIGVFVSIVMLVALLAVLGLAWRRRLPVEVVSLAVLSVAVLGDKALAPQYLIWLMPLWAYWPLRRGWVAAAALTALVYPFLYVEAHSYGPGFYLATAGAAVRNAVLITATVVWLREQVHVFPAPSRQTLSPPAKDGHRQEQAYALVG